MRFRATQTVGAHRVIVGTRADLIREGVWIEGPAWTLALDRLARGVQDVAGAAGDFGRAYRIERVA